MALSRKSLKAMGLTDEQVDSIAEAHGDTVAGLQDKIKDLEKKVADYDEVAKERDELKKGEDYKKKYEDEKKAFDDYKKSVEKEKTRSERIEAIKAYFESKGIKGDNLGIALRGTKDSEIEAITVEDGKIKDTKLLDDLIAGDFKGLVVTESKKGANVSKPQSNQQKSATMTKEEIYKKDEHGKYVLDTAARQAALVELMNNRKD